MLNAVAIDKLRRYLSSCGNSCSPVTASFLTYFNDCKFFATEPFRAPVDWKALGLYDYPTVVKRPMDLGTIKRNIADRKYKTIELACEDVRLVWSNCMTYNADGSDFFILAQNLSKKWEDKYSKLVNDLGLYSSNDGGGAASGDATAPSSAPSTGTSNTKISFDDKRSFARSLYKISKEDLGKLIVEVDTKCPNAVTKNSAEDECELNIDKINPTVFHDLKQFVQAAVKESSNNPNAGGGLASAGGKKKSMPNKRQKTS